jgi:hypothetical protein
MTMCIHPFEGRLFLLSGALRRDPAVEAWFRRQPEELGAIAKRWFDVMRDCGDDVRELLHDGQSYRVRGQRGIRPQESLIKSDTSLKAHLKCSFIPDKLRVSFYSGLRPEHFCRWFYAGLRPAH